MFDAVFAATTAETGVAPVVLGDEFGVRAGRSGLRFAARAHFKRFPFRTAAPRIRDLHSKIGMFDLVFHRHGQVWLAVKRARDRSDGALRDKFADKDDTASPRVRRFPPNVEAQIHFFEIAVQRNGKPEKTWIEEEKCD